MHPTVSGVGNVTGDLKGNGLKNCEQTQKLTESQLIVSMNKHQDSEPVNNEEVRS